MKTRHSKIRSIGFGSWLDSKIKESSLTPAELAAKAQVSEAYISMLRRGRRLPSYSVVIQLIGALNAHDDLDLVLSEARLPSRNNIPKSPILPKRHQPRARATTQFDSNASTLSSTEVLTLKTEVDELKDQLKSIKQHFQALYDPHLEGESKLLSEPEAKEGDLIRMLSLSITTLINEHDPEVRHQAMIYAAKTLNIVGPKSPIAALKAVTDVFKNASPLAAVPTAAD